MNMNIIVVAGGSGHDKLCKEVESKGDNYLAINTSKETKERSIKMLLKANSLYITKDYKFSELAVVLLEVAKLMHKKIIWEK